MTDCPTQPSIESSTGMRFSPWNVSYPRLTEQFAAAGLDPLKNTWNRIYDFTPAAAGAFNYEVVMEPEEMQEMPFDPSYVPH